MAEPFDIIFVDLDFTAYRPIVEQILDRGLLAKDGIILVDNGKFPEGLLLHLIIRQSDAIGSYAN